MNNPFSNILSKKDMLPFYRALYRYMKAGITLQSFFESYSKRSNKEQVKEIISTMRDDMAKGSSLAQAMQKHVVFPKYVTSMVSIGETMSTLPEILGKIIYFTQQDIIVDKAVSGAMKKGLAIISVVCVVICIALGMIIPKIAELLTRTKAELPFFTQQLVKFSLFLQSHALLIMVGIAILIAIFMAYKSKNEEKVALMLLKIPFFGPIIRARSHCHLFNIISICSMSDNMPIQQIFNYAARAIDNLYIKNMLLRAEQNILASGMNPADALQQADTAKILNEDVFIMMQVSLETSEWHTIFTDEGDDYQKILAELTESLGDKLMNIIVIPAGIVLGIIMMSVYSSVFSIARGAM